MQELPVVLLVKGSFQSPKVYEQLAQSLQALSFVTVDPRLPSCTDTDDPKFPVSTLVDDALAVHFQLTQQVEYEGKTMIHQRSILRPPRRRLSSIDFCAFIMDKGQSVLGTFGESPANDVHVDGRMFFFGAEQKLYHDPLLLEASLWGSRTLPSSHAI
ncbi:MAG: hypothetical protein Q9222_001414 [Ikaeria aurantiellina]